MGYPCYKRITNLNDDKRKVSIIHWQDDSVSIISLGGGGTSTPFISTAPTPEYEQIAIKHYLTLGLQIQSVENEYCQAE